MSHRRSDTRAGGPPRWARILFVTLLIVYLLGGLVVVQQALAAQEEVQPSQSSIFPVPGNGTLSRPPSGSDDRTVKSYFRYLDLQTYGTLPETYHVSVVTMLEFYGVAGITIASLYFFTFAWYGRLKTRDLYPVEVYNGYIAERGNPVDPFNWFVWAVMLIYAVVYVAVSLTYGQLY